MWAAGLCSLANSYNLPTFLAKILNKVTGFLSPISKFIQPLGPLYPNLLPYPPAMTTIATFPSAIAFNPALLAPKYSSDFSHYKSI